MAQTLAWAEADISREVWDEVDVLGYSSDDPEAKRDYKPGYPAAIRYWSVASF